MIEYTPNAEIQNQDIWVQEFIEYAQKNVKFTENGPVLEGNMKSSDQFKFEVVDNRSGSHSWCWVAYYKGQKIGDLSADKDKLTAFEVFKRGVHPEKCPIFNLR